MPTRPIDAKSKSASVVGSGTAVPIADETRKELKVAAE
jgi:hypothetical protein